MKNTLKHIAIIQTGFFAKPIAKGEIIYLQAKHFDENGILTSTLYPDLKADSASEKHLLRHGDVLFAAKGAKNFATWYESKNERAVASTSFFVIRLNEEYHNRILSEYLVWFLNHPNTQTLLKGKAIGTSIASISKAVLEELDIAIPPVETQKLILKITYLWKKENELKKQIKLLREKLIQQQLINAINKNNE